MDRQIGVLHQTFLDFVSHFDRSVAVPMIYALLSALNELDFKNSTLCLRDSNRPEKRDKRHAQSKHY